FIHELPLRKNYSERDGRKCQCRPRGSSRMRLKSNIRRRNLGGQVHEPEVTPTPPPAPEPRLPIGILDLSGRENMPVMNEIDNPLAYAAPVSRSAGSMGQELPGRVTLSRAEVELARSTGVTLEDSAKGKMRLAHEKKLGLRQNG